MGKTADVKKYKFPRWFGGKESACSAGAAEELGLIPGSRTSPGGGRGHPLQYSCLENPKGRGAGWATVDRVVKSWTWLKWLSMHTYMWRDVDLSCAQGSVWAPSQVTPGRWGAREISPLTSQCTYVENWHFHTTRAVVNRDVHSKHPQSLSITQLASWTQPLMPLEFLNWKVWGEVPGWICVTNAKDDSHLSLRIISLLSWSPC